MLSNEIAVIGRKCPVTGIIDPTMFDGVVMNIIDVIGIVTLITDGIFPKAALPEG